MKKEFLKKNLWRMLLGILAMVFGATDAVVMAAAADLPDAGKTN